MFLVIKSSFNSRELLVESSAKASAFEAINETVSHTFKN